MEYEIKDVQKWGIDEARKKFISENRGLVISVKLCYNKFQI